MSTPTDHSQDFTTDLGDGHDPFPFIEDENCNITGYGHPDPEAFAREINRYELVTAGSLDPDELWEADHLTQHWVRLDPDDDEKLLVCRSDDDGAFPVTTLWGQR